MSVNRTYRSGLYFHITLYISWRHHESLIRHSRLPGSRRPLRGPFGEMLMEEMAKSSLKSKSSTALLSKVTDLFAADNKLTSTPIKALKCNFPASLELYDRPTDRPDLPTNRRAGFIGKLHFQLFFVMQSSPSSSSSTLTRPAGQPASRQKQQQVTNNSYPYSYTYHIFHIIHLAFLCLFL